MTTAATLPAADRLYSLDGMRGIAAIVVFLYHAQPYVPLQFGGSAYLAVDFFFALSGYVIARSYGPRLAGAMTLSRFIKLRLVRLYPLFALGVLLGAVRALGQVYVDDPQAPTLFQLAAQFGLNGLMLPYPSADKGLFPLNGPAWSLFFEFAINIAFAAWLFRARGRWLALIMAAAAVTLVIGGLQAKSLNIGWNWPTFHYGVARTTYGFLAGVLLARLDLTKPPQKVLTGAFSFAPFLVLIAMLVIEPASGLRSYWDLFGALIVSPVLVYVGVRCSVTGAVSRKLCTLAGDLSYPLYAIHFPVILIVAFGLGLATSDPAALLAGLVVAVLAASALAAWAFDSPVRSWLARNALSRRPA